MYRYDILPIPNRYIYIYNLINVILIVFCQTFYGGPHYIFKLLKGSSRGSFVSPLTMELIPAFSQPFAIWELPSQLERWLNSSISHVACNSLITVSLKSTIISSVPTADSSIYHFELLQYTTS